MKRLFVGFIWLICLSCSSDASQIGADFFEDGTLDISYIDSSSVKLSTIKFDSLITSQLPRILLGTHSDERLGRVTACTYVKPQLGTLPDLDHSLIELDRLALVLRYDGYSYYDTTSLLTLHAYQLSQKIDLADDGYLYNTSNFSYSGDPLGSISFRPKPHQVQDSVEIVFSSSFADSFYEKLKADANEFSNEDKFFNYIRGIIVVPDTTVSSAILGFSPQTDLRLYYLDKSVVPAETRYISFPVNTAYSSTHIIANRWNTKLKPLSSYKDKLSAEKSDGESYLQAGAGLAMRIDMPYLRSLKQNENFYVTKAVLEIYPVRKSYDKFTLLPTTLRTYRVDRQNNILGETLSANLYEDRDLERDTHYEIDATEFVKQQMEREEINEDALLLLLTDESFRNTIDRIYFASPEKYKTRLKIYYASIMN